MLLPAEVYAELKKNEHGTYAATLNISDLATFYYNGLRGSTLIVKSTQSNAEEFVLSGIFEVDRQDCYLNSDGSFDPNNTFRQTFSDIKLNCRLRPATHDPDFAFSVQDWPLMINNLNKLEMLAPLEKGEDRRNVVHIVQGMDIDGGFIKVVHPLFEVRRSLQTFR